MESTLLQTLTTTARVLEDAARQLRAAALALAQSAETASVRCARCAEWLPFDRVRLLPPAPGVLGPEAVCHACLADERTNAAVDARREDDVRERAAGRDY